MITRLVARALQNSDYFRAEFRPQPVVVVNANNAGMSIVLQFVDLLCWRNTLQPQATIFHPFGSGKTARALDYMVLHGDRPIKPSARRLLDSTLRRLRQAAGALAELLRLTSAIRRAAIEVSATKTPPFRLARSDELAPPRRRAVSGPRVTRGPTCPRTCVPGQLTGV